MPDQNNNVNYIRNTESEINIESIITAPFVAVSKANTMLLSGQARFILDYCFEKSETDGSSDFSSDTIYKPVMINLSMTKSVTKLIDDQNNVGKQIEQLDNVEVVFAVPLLSIIPINSIAIDKIKVEFNMEITSITSYENVSNKVIERKAQLNGKISSDKVNQGEKNSKSESSNNSSRTLSVEIEARTLPLPLGITNILDLYAKNIQPIKYSTIK